MQAVSKEWPYVFRGPQDGRRFFVVLGASPLRLDGGGGSGGERAESDEDALREPFGGVGVDGVHSFACISSRSLRSSSSHQGGVALGIISRPKKCLFDPGLNLIESLREIIEVITISAECARGNNLRFLFPELFFSPWWYF